MKETGVNLMRVLPIDSMLCYGEIATEISTKKSHVEAL